MQFEYEKTLYPVRRMLCICVSWLFCNRLISCCGIFITNVKIHSLIDCDAFPIFVEQYLCLSSGWVKNLRIHRECLFNELATCFLSEAILLSVFSEVDYSIVRSNICVFNSASKIHQHTNILVALNDYGPPKMWINFHYL